MKREIQTARIYRHFKGKFYYVMSVATHTETNEQMVVYQAMYGDYKIYVRPIDMFLEEIDVAREDNVTGQKYRFTLKDDSMEVKFNV